MDEQLSFDVTKMPREEVGSGVSGFNHYEHCICCKSPLTIEPSQKLVL